VVALDVEYLIEFTALYRHQAVKSFSLRLL